jgi:diguanylate cyclase (GGDEF)-like protein/PAS domain S-box-containing protein
MDGSEQAVPWRRSLQTRVMAGVLIGLIGLIGAVLLVVYWRGYALLAERERIQAAASAHRLAGEIGQQLALVEGLAASLARLGERLPRDAVLWKAVLPNVLDLEPHAALIAGGGLWPEPEVFRAGVDRASFFWGRDRDGSLQFYDDYNDPAGPGYHLQEWYVPVRHQQRGRCYWSRSYRDPFTNEAMVTCSIGMHAQTRFIGVSTVDLRLAGLQQFVAERGRSLQGYAMMIDRNGTFITLPAASEHGQSERLSESLSFAELAAEMRSLQPMASFLDQPVAASDAGLEKLAQLLNAATPEIDAAEARRVAAQLRSPVGQDLSVRQAIFERDPFLNEPVLVTALRLDGTHWQLVVVQPRRLVHEAVQSVLKPVALSLALVIALIVLVAAMLVRRALVEPIRRMAAQMLVADQSGDASQPVDVPGRDELGLLATTFNRHAQRLSSSLAQLRASAEQFRSVTALAHDALIQVDDAGLIRSVNPAGERLFGCSEADLSGQPVTLLLPWNPALEMDGEAPDPSTSTRSRAASRVRVVNALRPTGDSFPAEVSASYWRGLRAGLHNIQVRDISERRQAEERVRQLATQDSLTGLPNRVLFQDRLQQAVKQNQRTRRLLGLLYLDLDNFKLANDSLGHAVGDSLLRAVSERLLACVGNEGSVARLGGDEFAILLPAVLESAEAGEMAARVIAALEPGFSIDGHYLQIGVSIGVILCPTDGTDPDQLLRKADLAMYHAKAQGRNTYRFFTERLRTELLERSALLADLKQAVLADQFTLHYQPILATRSGAVHAVEALLRWRHPTKGLISPESFIPLAERSGLIVPIGQWVIDRALGELAELSPATASGPPLRLAVNLSLAQLVDPALVDWLEACLRKHAIAPHRLELELTETALLHDLDHGIEVLRRLKALGVGLVIDDFGIGQSSLAYLKRFPVEKLKIDRSFVIGVATDRDSAAICRAVIGMGRSLGLLVVAEGVENAADLAFVREQGFDYAQGYHFTRALPAAELREWVAERQAALVG